MMRTRKLTAVTIVILFALLLSVVLPTSVLADDSTPPAVETSVAPPPTDEPVVTEATSEPPAATEAPTQVPETELTASLEEGLPTEVPATEIAATEAPASDKPDEPDMNLVEIVQVAAEQDITLADASGDPLVMGTTEAAETLADGDPWFTRGGITYRFFPSGSGGCSAYAGDPTVVCTEFRLPYRMPWTM